MINDELVRVIGVEYDWAGFIASVAANRASSYRNNALMDDIVADVTGDIIIAARAGKGLTASLLKARGDADPLKALKKVMMVAVWYRVGNAIKHRYKPRMIQFSANSPHEGVAAPVESGDHTDYAEMLADELEKMAEGLASTKGRGWTRRAARYRFAARMVPDKVAGLSFDELMVKYKVKSSATMMAMFDDIGQALARVAVKLDDPTLIQGSSHVLVG